MTATESDLSFEIHKDLQVAGLLAAVGNNEAKALLIGGMEEGTYYSSLGLARVLEGIQGGVVTTKLGHKATGSYASASFMPLGLVAKADFGEVLRFTLTDRGADIGKATAGHLLELSAKYDDISLRRLLGMTASKNPTGVRPPYARYQIYKGLLTSSPLSVQEVAGLTGEDPDITASRLEEMEDDGVLQTQLQVRQGNILKVIDKSAIGELSGRGNTSVHYLVQELLKEREIGERFTTRELFDELVRDYDLPSTSQIYDVVKARLFKLKEEGALHRDRISYSSERVVSIAEGKEEIISELVSIIDDLHEPSEVFLNDGKRKMNTVLADQSKVRRLLKKAVNNSPHTQTVSKEQRLAAVLSAISEAGEPLDIQGITARINDRRITDETVKKALRELRAERAIELGEKIGRAASKWQLAK